MTISKQGIEDHWTYSTAEWLYAVLLRAVQCLISAKAVALPLLQRFAGVYIEDGSTIRLPDGLERYWRGCRGGNGQAKGTKAGVKLTLRLELSEGTLYGPLLQDGRRHESTSLLQQLPLVSCASLRSICSIRSRRFSGAFIAALHSSLMSTVTYEPCKIRSFWYEVQENSRKTLRQETPFAT